MPDQNAVPSVDQVRSLVGEQLPRLAGEEVQALDAPGTTSAIFRIGSRFVARFPRAAEDPAGARGALSGELRAMEEFRRASPVAAPAPCSWARPGTAGPVTGAC